MPDERASGMILFREGARGREYLLIKHRSGGHWGFPKGRLEPGEDELAAAQREVAEEVGIPHPEIVPGFSHLVSYRFVRDRELVRKEVRLFLARADGPGSPQREEIEAMEWLPVPEALSRLTYPEGRGALLQAEAFLQREGSP
ncbi:MAG: NUDIX domain-containing protein [Candidatus Bipolaricaulota bacterium]|nr:NUDIX domain-containing protein [Candidatus Bipolaricaulota bacterium]